jgi:hypothetical protein
MMCISVLLFSWNKKPNPIFQKGRSLGPCEAFRSVPTHSSSRNPSSTGGWLSPPVLSVDLSISKRSPSDRPSSLATQTAESATKCHSTAYKSRRRRRSLRSGQDSLSSTGSSRCLWLWLVRTSPHGCGLIRRHACSSGVWIQILYVG